uniref:Uncharacterized protein n=1 Tax=Chromera velia CCMP2878 TaxID=1169474 RepID=A0A0G4F775_9ALVE|eukprot:Cvel_15481.t1-p1 / transcript=Cvel_15481.t1 / gene=Cvel_15481 / organism=Chromera_velia_CCMP2878 / gene_product=hypothetical protein / transcript_product=hypothetical protein / location=Cvel_scaffold1148:18589-19286(+) / protein_length=75 / sequence_SO=supercontig / SO=protein_coding / is_pseudo=false
MIDRQVIGLRTRIFIFRGGASKSQKAMPRKPLGSGGTLEMPIYGPMESGLQEGESEEEMQQGEEEEEEEAPPRRR